MNRDPATLYIEEITTTALLERLRTEWSQLWAEDPCATPFQSPEWLVPWWRHIGEGELWTLAVRAGGAEKGRLVGLVPLYIYTHPQSAIREVFPLGIATTDYLDGVFAPGWATCAAAAAVAHLNANSPRWDAVDLPQLRPGSPLLRAANPGWAEQTTACEPCLVLSLPARVQDLHQCVPCRMLNNLAYYQRRAGKLGRLHAEEADPKNLNELYASLLRLHGARWAQRGEYGVLSGQGVQSWHTEALPGLLSLGVLRLYELRLDERVIAVLYGLTDRQKAVKHFYYYLSGFDPDFRQLSPGTLVIGHAIECAVGEGAESFDFLRGRESYKYLWGAKDSMLYRWHIPPSRCMARSAATHLDVDSRSAF